jgi:hypothetical protein
VPQKKGPVLAERPFVHLHFVTPEKSGVHLCLRMDSGFRPPRKAEVQKMQEQFSAAGMTDKR